MKARYEKDDVRNAAGARLAEIVELCLGEPPKGAGVEMRVSGRKSGLGTITINRKKLAWHNKSSDEDGDIFDLWAVYQMGLPNTDGRNFSAALASLGAYLGVTPVSGSVDPAQREREKAARVKARKIREEEQAAAAKVEAEQRAGNVAALVAAAVPLDGSPGAAYLESRGITATLPDSFAGFVPTGVLRKFRKGMIESDAGGLVVWSRSATGDVIGAQRITLEADGGKRLIETPEGMAAKFTTGAQGITALPATASDITGGAIVVAEGPETGAAIWQECGCETWVVFGVSGFKAVIDLLPRDRRVIFAPDADAIGSQARKAFDDALAVALTANNDCWVAETPKEDGVKGDLLDTLGRAGGDAVRAAVRSARAAIEYQAAGKAAHLRKLDGAELGTACPLVEVNFLSASDAAAASQAAVDAAFKAAHDWQSQEEDSRPDAPVHVTRATAGLGKSQAVRAAMAAAVEAAFLPAGTAIYIAVPTTALADEACRDFRQLYPTISATVFRGRAAENPDADMIGGETMCSKPDLAKAASRAGASVRYSICERKGEAADCRSGCLYMGQLETQARVVFLSHEYVTKLGLPAGLPTPWLVVIDEAFDLSLSASITAAAFSPIMSNKFREPDLAQCARRSESAGAFAIHAIQGGGSGPDALRREGFTSDDIEAFLSLEGSIAASWADGEPTPAMSDGEKLALFELRKNAPERSSNTRARFWKIMLETWGAAGPSERLLPGKGRGDNGEQYDQTVMHWCGSIKPNAPLLMIDADASELVTGHIWPARVFTRIDAALNTDVVQVTDSAFSKRKLLNDGKASKRRRLEFGGVVTREIIHAGGDPGKVLVVAPQAVVIALLKDEADSGRADRLTSDQIADAAKSGGLRYRGAPIAWFGPSTKGVNRWSHCETVVILGSNTPRVDDVETTARAIFGDTVEALQFITPDDAGRVFMPERQEGFAMRDGSRASAPVRFHPDTRIDALLRGIREQSSLQALARIRAVHSPTRKRVVVCSNIPLEGLQVDALTTWENFKPERLALAAFERWQSCTARSVPFGIRLSSGGLSGDAPGVFETPECAKQWFKNNRFNGVKPLIETLIREMTPLNIPSSLCEVTVRLAGQRGPLPTKALIFCGVDEVEAAAVAIWGAGTRCDLVAVVAVDPVEAVQQPAISEESHDAALSLAARVFAAGFPSAGRVVSQSGALIEAGADSCEIIGRAANDTGVDPATIAAGVGISCKFGKGAAA